MPHLDNSFRQHKCAQRYFSLGKLRHVKLLRPRTLVFPLGSDRIFEIGFVLNILESSTNFYRVWCLFSLFSFFLTLYWTILDYYQVTFAAG